MKVNQQLAVNEVPDPFSSIFFMFREDRLWDNIVRKKQHSLVAKQGVLLQEIGGDSVLSVFADETADALTASHQPSQLVNVSSSNLFIVIDGVAAMRLQISNASKGTRQAYLQQKATKKTQHFDIYSKTDAVVIHQGLQFSVQVDRGSVDCGFYYGHYPFLPLFFISIDSHFDGKTNSTVDVSLLANSRNCQVDIIPEKRK